MYRSADSLYCYPHSFTLKNLHDIRDAAVLAEAEAYAYAVRNAELLSNAPAFELSFRFLKLLHQNLFQDMYEWAGTTRRVDISKGTTCFAVWEQIDAEAEKLFRLTREESNSHAHTDAAAGFLDTAAEFLIELNVIHPFREGNGRVMRLFTELWAQSIELDFDWNNTSAEKYLEAVIHGVHHDSSLIRNVLMECLREDA